MLHLFSVYAFAEAIVLSFKFFNTNVYHHHFRYAPQIAHTGGLVVLHADAPDAEWDTKTPQEIPAEKQAFCSLQGFLWAARLFFLLNIDIFTLNL